MNKGSDPFSGYTAFAKNLNITRRSDYVQDTIRVVPRYDVQLSDGRRIESVEILGTTDPRDGQFPLGGWDGLLVLRLESGKKAYVRQTSVRCVVE